jgi:hypothetical protein
MGTEEPHRHSSCPILEGRKPVGASEFSDIAKPAASVLAAANRRIEPD